MTFRFQCVGESDEWYTPPHVFSAMDVRFDLDVSSPGADVVHWIPADRCFTAESLEKKWSGLVWMNPPFGARNGLIPWLKKFFEHGNGVALVPDRTSAPWWQTYASQADSVLFVSPKLKFISSDGKSSGTPAQGTTLLASGKLGVRALENAQKANLGTLFTPVMKKG